MNKLIEKNGRAIYEDYYGKLYLYKEENESAVVLAKLDDSFLLIKQYRKPVESYVIQLPGGKVESGESIEHAARREFLEETGYECGGIHYLGKMLSASWISNEVTHVFYTDELTQITNQRLEEYEKIEVLAISLTDCINQVRRSEINDSELTFAILQAILQGYVPSNLK